MNARRRPNARPLALSALTLAGVAVVGALPPRAAFAQTVLSSPSPFSASLPPLSTPAAKPLTPNQAQSLRDALRFRASSFGFNFGFSARRGFYLVTGSDALNEAAEKRKTIAEMEKMPPPASPTARGERLLALAREYKGADRDADARAAFTKAETIFRALVSESKSDNDRGRYLARVGEAQAGLDNAEKAEKTLREAVRIAPGEWETWTALGQQLTALEALMPKEAFANIPKKEIEAALENSATMFALIARGRPSPETVARLRARIVEGQACLDRAVACAPLNRPEPYFNRAGARLSTPLLDMMLVALEKASVAGGSGGAAGAAADPADQAKIANLASGMFSPDVVADLAEAAKRNPRGPLMLGVLSVVQAMRAMMTNDNALDDATKRQLTEDMDQLLLVSEDKTQSPADRALGFQVATFVSYALLKDDKRTDAASARGVKAFPESVPVREARLFSLVLAERWSEAREVSATLVRDAPTTGSLLTLGKINVSLNRYDEAETPLRAALKKASNDGRAAIALAVTLLKNSASSPQKVAEAGALLAAWDARGAEAFSGDDAKDDRANLLAARAVHAALTGKLADARALAARAVEADEESSSVRTVRDQLAAL